MSKYAECTLQMRETKYLVEALEEMGYKPEVHHQGAELGRYYSEQEGKSAHVIIRRCQLKGAYGDIGFARQAGGRLSVIVDELDQQSGYGTKWLGRVQQLYQEKKTLAVARAKGYILKSREVVQTAQGQQVRLQFVTRR
jgi:Protein of unknown function (DUF1257)